jgi:hypothetical protein
VFSIPSVRVEVVRCVACGVEVAGGVPQWRSSSLVSIPTMFVFTVAFVGSERGLLCRRGSLEGEEWGMIASCVGFKADVDGIFDVRGAGDGDSDVSGVKFLWPGGRHIGAVRSQSKRVRLRLEAAKVRGGVSGSCVVQLCLLSAPRLSPRG